MSLFMADAHAAANAATPAAHAGGMSSIILLVGFMVVCYFMLVRPQARRAKEHKQLLDNLHKGDEVATAGGLLGEIQGIQEDIVELKIADNITIKIQKPSISTMLPKGTLKAKHKA